jgi:hypothetical protein
MADARTCDIGDTIYATGYYTYGWLLQILWLILTTAASAITACKCDYRDYYGYYSLFVTMVTAGDWLLLLRPLWLLLRVVTAAIMVSTGSCSYHSFLWLLYVTGYVGYYGCYR